MANGIGEQKINKNAMKSFVFDRIKSGRVSAKTMNELGKTVAGKRTLTREAKDISKDDGR